MTMTHRSLGSCNQKIKKVQEPRIYRRKQRKRDSQEISRGEETVHKTAVIIAMLRHKTAHSSGENVNRINSSRR